MGWAQRHMGRPGVLQLEVLERRLLLSGGAPGDPPSADDLPLMDTLTKDGITWVFSEAVPVGQFVNGDYYVVGSVTITDITPLPADGRNGSVLNLPVDNDRSGFDDRVSSGRYDPSLRADLPIAMVPGDTLISSVSVDQMGVLPAPLRPSDTAISPVLSVSILTCLADAVPEDAFRPSYCDQDQEIYLADDLQWDLLPSLPLVPSTLNIEEWAERFRRPWMDVCFYGFDAPIGYMPHYGREIGRATGMATLMLMLDFTQEEKEDLLVNFVQYGIDLWGIAEAGYVGWYAHGGHGSGRKWPVVFAGMMLGDEEMASPTVTMPDLQFGEDMQTMYDDGWTGADVVYAGHMGADGHPAHVGWGAYEHLYPSEWLSMIGENYRRCCTSLSWVGQALAARIMGAQDEWAHDAFFDYVDRWMTEDDTEHIQIILAETGTDYSASWARQGQAWDTFVEDMWATYRYQLPPAVDSRDPAASHSMAEGESQVFSLTASDPEGQTLGYTWTLDGGQVGDDSAAYAYSPGYFDAGAHQIVCQVSDGTLTVHRAWDVTVTDVNRAPSLSTVSVLTGAVEDDDFAVTYAALAGAADADDPDGDPVSFRVESVRSGSLTKGGGAVVPGETLLESGENLVWHPDANANGTLAAFSIVAWDGQAASDTTVEVQVETAPDVLPGVVDDDDADYADSGWPAGAYDGACEGGYVYSAPGVGDEWATWTFTDLAPGTYHVYGTWLARARRATDAPFEVLDGTVSKGTARADQTQAPDDVQAEGYWWESLGVYRVDSGTLTVRLTDGADGNVIADAIRVVETTDQAVADDGSCDYSDTGWAVGAYAGGYLGDYAYSRPGDGSEWAEWTFDGLAPGHYQVLTTWVGKPRRATDAPFEVSDGAASEGTVWLDQTASPSDVEWDGHWWASLGVYDVQNGALTVRLTDDADGNVIADAVRVVPATEPLLADDGQEGYADSGWARGAYLGGYLGDYHYSAAGTGDEWATWTFSGLDSGSYGVYATWVARAYRATNAPFEVLDGALSRGTVLADQTLAPDDLLLDGHWWHCLGSFDVENGALTVRLTDDADGNVIADAVRLLW